MAELRQADTADALLISRIIANSWRGAYQELLDPVYLARLPEETWLASMRAWLDSGRMYGFIAMADGFPVGCVVYGRARDEAHGDWGEIVSLYVLPEAMREASARSCSMRLCPPCGRTAISACTSGRSRATRRRSASTTGADSSLRAMKSAMPSADRP